MSGTRFKKLWRKSLTVLIAAIFLSRWLDVEKIHMAIPAPLEHMAFFWLDVFSQLIGSSLPMFNLRGFDSTDFYTCLLILDRIAVAYVISVAGTLKLRNLFFKSEKYCECCSSWVRALACKDGIHSIDKPQCMFCS